MGRRKTTGRFDTREELEERVLYLYHATDNNMSQIAKTCQVSQPVVSKIIDANPNWRNQYLATHQTPLKEKRVKYDDQLEKRIEERKQQGWTEDQIKSYVRGWNQLNV